MSSTTHRLYILIVAIIITIISGSIGYFLLFQGQYSFIDCIYMTVISITSVGYGEVIEVSGNIPAQIFTMILITFGMGIILYALSTLTAILIEGELSGVLRIRRMQKKISGLESHYIVCGGGNTSRPLIRELTQNQEHVVLIEPDPEEIEKCRVSDRVLYITGDATDDTNLEKAGIDKAAGIIIVLPSDKDTLYVTMTARLLNQKIRIISQMKDSTFEPKLKKAGANRVVSPNIIGALRMASEMIRPTAVDFLDTMLRSEKGNLRIHEIAISSSSSMVGKPISRSGIKDQFQLLILGAREMDSEDIIFNPPPNTVISENMTLAVMGTIDKISKVKKTIK